MSSIFSNNWYTQYSTVYLMRVVKGKKHIIMYVVAIKYVNIPTLFTAVH
jgi:hypothetical protein